MNNPFKGDFTKKLKAFLHDPVDKCFNIMGHEGRAESYASSIGVYNLDSAKGPDIIASCMERSLLPKDSPERHLRVPLKEIKHPLSEGSIKVPDDVDVTNKGEVFKNIIKKVYQQIGAKEITNLDDKGKFFFLWRNLQDFIFNNAKNEDWIKYLPILPADTRVPDHSIWEHLKITSSISAFYKYKKGKPEESGLTQNNSLLIFSIGPVQSFITQARKTQDFYMGSFILSFLTFKAMEVIIERYGPTNIIYPDLYKQPLVDWFIRKNLGLEPFEFKEEEKENIKLPTIPNRFVAILPFSDESKINNEIVKEMEKKIRETVEKAKNKIFSEFKLELLEVIKEGIMEMKGEIKKIMEIIERVNRIRRIRSKISSQLSEFPEIYWVALPWKVGNKDIFTNDFSDVLDNDILSKYKGLWDLSEKLKHSNIGYGPNIGLLYGLTYTALERFMGARKNVRIFKQPDTDVKEKGRKCSVCGERDVIFFRESTNKSKFTRYNNLVVDLTDKNIPSKSKYIAEGEGLCAVCFLKRTFEIYLEKEVSNLFKNITFPSTSEIACSDFKEKILRDAKNLYQEYLEKFRSLLGDHENLEGTWFYEENLTEKYIKDELGISIEPNKIENLRKLLKEITNIVGKPNPYYALIYLDGDNMGKWLSGELLPDIKHAYASEVWDTLLEKYQDFKDFKKELIKISPRKILTPAIHASISTALRNYALEFVRKIVEEEHLGKLVYAGGDDVLAFVNLKDLLNVMHKLRWAFSGNISIDEGKIKVDLSNKTGFVEKDGRFLLTMGPKASVSMGVVIAHYKTPLQIVIKKVFEMEKIAKGNGKDSFAMCFIRRSGEERIATAKWLYLRNNQEEDTVEVLKEIASAFEEGQSGYIAKGFIRKINESLLHLKSNGTFIASEEIFKSELLRLLRRSYIQPKYEKIEKSEKEEFIRSISEKMNSLFWNTGGNVDNFINFCITLTFIHKLEGDSEEDY